MTDARVVRVDRPHRRDRIAARSAGDLWRASLGSGRHDSGYRRLLGAAWRAQESGVGEEEEE